MGKHLNQKPLGDHAVGYKRPPRRRKGDAKRTPNPPRTTGDRQVMVDLFSALHEEVNITVRGKKVKMSVGEMIIKKTVALAAKGEPWAMRRTIDLQLRLLAKYELDKHAKIRSFANLERYAKATNNPLSPEAAAQLKEFYHRCDLGIDELFEPYVLTAEAPPEPPPPAPRAPRRYPSL